MTISRAKTFIGAFAFTALAFQPAIFAQDAQPRSLTPRSLTPPAAPTGPEVRSISGGINVQQLDQVSTEAIGILSRDQSLPITMWQGSNRSIVENLLGGLPTSHSTLSLRSLQEKILLSAARPPEGQAGPVSLLYIRASKLFEMGHYDQALQLIDSLPPAEVDGALSILKAQALLLKGDLAGACSMAAGFVQENENPFWVKTLALCKMLAGQGDQAMLSLSILREEGEIDPLFDTLMNAIQFDEATEIESLASANALGLSLLKPAKATLSDEITRNATQTLNLIIAGSDHLDVTTRANAIIKLLNRGYDKFDLFRTTLSGFEFSDDDKGNALEVAQNLDPISSQALLYQVATSEGQLDVIKAETISLAMDQALERNALQAFAPIFRDVTLSIKPTADLIWFAPNAVKCLLASQQIEAARGWFLLLQNAALRDQEAATTWNKIRPLAIFSGFASTREDISTGLRDWFNEQGGQEDTAQKANILFSLVEGLGIEVAPSLWLQLEKLGQDVRFDSPKTGYWINMNKASIQNKIAETVVYQLLATSGRPTQQFNPVFMKDSLFALRSIGKNVSARNLALEIALLSDL